VRRALSLLAGFGGRRGGSETAPAVNVDGARVEFSLDGEAVALPPEAQALPGARPLGVLPRVVTEKVRHDTDDPAIWVNRADPARSLVIGTDKDTDGALYAFDLQGRVVLWNRRLEEVSGYSPEVLKTRAADSFFDEADAERVRQSMAQAFAEGEAQVEAALISADGTQRPHLFVARRLVTDKGTLIVGTAVDIGDRVRGERLADLAHNAVEIADRNLYERSCDVRWWATEPAVVEAAADPSPERRSHAARRLGVVLSAYTVYRDLWLADAQGRVIAHGRPDRFPGVAGLNVSGEAWFREATASRGSDDFAVADITPSPCCAG